MTAEDDLEKPYKRNSFTVEQRDLKNRLIEASGYSAEWISSMHPWQKLIIVVDCYTALAYATRRVVKMCKTIRIRNDVNDEQSDNKALLMMMMMMIMRWCRVSQDACNSTTVRMKGCIRDVQCRKGRESGNRVEGEGRRRAICHLPFAIAVNMYYSLHDEHILHEECLQSVHTNWETFSLAPLCFSVLSSPAVSVYSVVAVLSYYC